jgi:hypothetical protein
MGSLLARSIRSELSDSPSYARQQYAMLTITASPELISTTVTTGVIAINYNISPADITNWATRFAGTFDEYRILSARMRVRPVSATTGVTAMWFDEKNVSAAPTLTEAQERTLNVYTNSNANAKSYVTMVWRARDLVDLQYTSTAITTVVPATFKLYSDNTNFGAPIAVTPAWLLEPEFTIEFRGLNP